MAPHPLAKVAEWLRRLGGRSVEIKQRVAAQAEP